MVTGSKVEVSSGNEVIIWVVLVRWTEELLHHGYCLSSGLRSAGGQGMQLACIVPPILCNSPVISE